jgi:hypothetical protein
MQQSIASPNVPKQNTRRRHTIKKQALVLQGMTPAADAATPPPPPTHYVIQLDGRVVGYATEAASRQVVERLRLLKAAGYSEGACGAAGAEGRRGVGAADCAMAVSSSAAFGWRLESWRSWQRGVMAAPQCSWSSLRGAFARAPTHP